MTKERYEELKPCPFCGGENFHIDEQNVAATVTCEDCRARHYKTEWNTRPKEVELMELLVEAREALQKVSDSCLCERFKTKGFDYGEKHPHLGNPPMAERWNTPLVMIKSVLTKLTAALEK